MIKKRFLIILIFLINSLSLANDKVFMGYYRIWRDKTFEQDNDRLKAKDGKTKATNELSMLDIPEGVNVVNIFGYDKYDKGQEHEKYQKYFDTLRNVYAPELKKRGIKLVYGINYKRLITVPKRPATSDEINEWTKEKPETTEAEKQKWIAELEKINNNPSEEEKKEYIAKKEKQALDNFIEQRYQSKVDPTDEEIDAWAKKIYEENVLKNNLDGIDIDMELNDENINDPTISDEIKNKIKNDDPEYLTERKRKVGERMIRALSKYLGPKSSNPNSLLVYDFNSGRASKQAIDNLKEYFNYLFFQNYGKGNGTHEQYSAFEQRNKRALENLDVADDKFVPGLTYAEELSPEGTKFVNYHLGNFEASALYKFATDKKYAGMFLYALDRDGMTHNSPDSNTIVKTNFLWTKTLIQAFNGVTLEHAKKVAFHNLERIKYAKKIEEDNSNNTGKTFLEEKKEAIEKINKETKLIDVNKHILGLVEIGVEKIKALNPDYDPTLEEKIMKMPEILESMTELDNTKEEDRKEDEINNAYIELAKALGDKRPVQSELAYKLGQFLVTRNGFIFEKSKLLNGVFSTLDIPISTLDERFNTGYTFSKLKSGYYHSVNISGMVYKNIGLFTNISTNFGGVNTLLGVYSNVHFKNGKYIPNIALGYVFDSKDIDTHFISLKLANSFKFYAYKNKGLMLNPSIDLDMELGAYHSTINNNSNKFKALYNHKVKVGLDLSYKINSFNIITKFGAFNTLTANKDKYIYDFGANIEAKLLYDIDKSMTIGINSGYTRTIKDNLFNLGLEFSKLF